MDNFVPDQRRSAPNAAQTINFARQLADAAVLCVPFTVIAFQPARYDGYDSEKMGLIGILVAVIVGAVGMEGLKALQQRRGSSKPSPLAIAVLALFAVTVISTLLSLSPSLSFWGEPGRSQGLLSLCMYGVLFFQATRLSSGRRSVLMPSLLMAAIPVCLWQILSFTRGDNRLLLGSSAGNPNFLSSWIVMVLIYCIPQIVSRAAAWPRPWMMRRWAMLVFYALPLALLIVSLVINASRGALFGLAVGSLFCVIVLASAAANKRLLIAIPLVLVVGLTVYSAASLWIRANPDKVTGVNGERIARIFVPYDRVRLDVWRSAATIVALQGQPVFNISRQPDPLAALRPLVGYGPETVEQLQSRFGNIFGVNVVVNSFHNAVFDMLITQGWLGLLVWLAMLEVAFYQGLRWLGVVPSGSVRQWIGWQIAGAAAGWLILSVMAAPVGPAVLAPVGLSVGGVIGILCCIGWQGFRPQTNDRRIMGQADKMLVVAILAVLVAQWVDNLFGFGQGATQPLQWILLGLLAGVIRSPGEDRSAKPETADHAQESLSARIWIGVTAIGGLFTAQTFGIAFQSQAFRQDTGSAELPLLLGVILCFGLIGAALHQDKGQRIGIRDFVITTGAILLTWAVFITIKMQLIGASGAAIDHLVTGPASATLAADLARAIIVSAGSGLLMLLIVMCAQVITLGLSRPVLNITTVAWMTMCIAIACSAYSTQYVSGVLHNLGNTVVQRTQSTSQQGSPEFAIAALHGAADYVPSNVVLRLHYVSAMASTLLMQMTPEDESARRQQITDNLAQIFREQPYFVNTLEWRNFNDSYASLLQSKP